jgi:hypothetical protein
VIDAVFYDFGSLHFYSFYQPSALDTKVYIFFLEFLKVVFTAGIFWNNIVYQDLHIPSFDFVAGTITILGIPEHDKFLSLSFRLNLLNFQL